jgi:hypothetical protein
LKPLSASGSRTTSSIISSLDPGEIAEGKFDLDVVGHYARPDVFRLMSMKKRAFRWHLSNMLTQADQIYFAPKTHVLAV